MQHGDIVATDAVGMPFVDLITAELKRGYNRATLHDLLDKPSKSADQEWEKWIAQAWESHCQAGSYSWMLIAKRDRREAVVLIPSRLYESLRPEIYAITPMLTICHETETLYATHLSSFLKNISPDTIKSLAKMC